MRPITHSRKPKSRPTKPPSTTLPATQGAEIAAGYAGTGLAGARFILEMAEAAGGAVENILGAAAEQISRAFSQAAEHYSSDIAASAKSSLSKER